MNLKHDISGPEDVKLMVDEFYKLVREDEMLAPIFLFRLNTYWQPHLEKMYSFWNAALFGQKGYTGNPFAKHATMPVDAAHFNRWISLFLLTINTHFEGPVAEATKRRAQLMAANFQKRISALNAAQANLVLV